MNKDTLFNKISKMVSGLVHDDIFPEVRQRVAAYKYYREYWNSSESIVTDDFLDDAYRFLYTSVSPDFVIFCAKKENMDPLEYTKMLVEDKESKFDKTKRLDKIRELDLEVRKYKSIIAGALPYLVLYDCGRYDTKHTLIEKAYKAREILQKEDPNNQYIIEMFKDWQSLQNKEKSDGKTKKKSKRKRNTKV